MASIILSILCLFSSRLSFVQSNLTWVIVLDVIGLFGVCGVALWLVLSEKMAYVKGLISLYAFLIFCLILIFIFQKTGFFQLASTSEGLQEYIEKAGAWMPMLYILLQYLQVILLPIPTIVSTIAGLALFGPFQTMIYSFIGIVLGSITAFIIGRKLGYKAVAWIIGQDTLNKWRKKLKGKDNLILTLMFVLPLFPDDILCFVAGVSSMSNRYFLIMIMLTRLVGIAGTCYSFDLIPVNTWWGVLIWLSLISIIILVFIFVHRNINKIQRYWKRRTKEE
jgi:uncharacterized membrane protein YdjX (TVP38/TMEM64 family)